MLSMLILSALFPMLTSAQTPTTDFPGIGVLLPGGGVDPSWIDDFLNLNPQQTQPLESPAPTPAPTLSPQKSPATPQHPTEPPLIKPTPQSSPQPPLIVTKKPIPSPIVTKKPIPIIKKTIPAPVQTKPQPTVQPTEASILYSTFPINTSMKYTTEQNKKIYAVQSPNTRVIISLGLFACLLLFTSVLLIHTGNRGKKSSTDIVLIDK